MGFTRGLELSFLGRCLCLLQTCLALARIGIELMPLVLRLRGCILTLMFHGTVQLSNRNEPLDPANVCEVRLKYDRWLEMYACRRVGDAHRHEKITGCLDRAWN